MATSYQITHVTEYLYEQAVSSSYGQLHLLPRDLPSQRCSEASITVDPTPELYRERLDYFGNKVSYFALHQPHRKLTVTAHSVVEVDDRSGDASLFGQRNWESVRDAVREGGYAIPWDASQYVLASPRIPLDETFRAYAQPSFEPGRAIFEAVQDLSSRVHADFEYEPGSTSVTTPLHEAFEQRRGVCQDFAHLTIACLRTMGLPARYVSGYLETDPPLGRPKLVGVDGSHAWVSLLIPEAGWVSIDPTNDQWVGGRYIVTAVGRDYEDVPPMNGVIYTEGKTEKLEVKVDVTALS